MDSNFVPTPATFFINRIDAGQKLALRLVKFRHESAIVFALPRGGVVVAAEVAKILDLPLEIVVARKIGHRSNPEYAICAISEANDLVCNPQEIIDEKDPWFQNATKTELTEAQRRKIKYLENHEPISAQGKIAILVDDGVATGLTARAAIQALRRQKPQKIVLATPMIASDTAERLTKEVDEIISLTKPEIFSSGVSAYYLEFPQISDEEVMMILRTFHKNQTQPLVSS